jgi:short-subunit dehydrogenase
MSEVQGKTALVTGASSGIGYELAKCFAADGCNLILVSRSKEELANIAETSQMNTASASMLLRKISLSRILLARSIQKSARKELRFITS